MAAMIGGLSWAENKKELAMDGFRGVPGVPEGWELVRITDNPKSGEFAIELPDRVVVVKDTDMWELAAIVRKIEKPKRWRPFASAEEFKPHRERWWKWKGQGLISPPARYSDESHNSTSWRQSFDEKVFDDGTPFGVEVTDGE
jgi:hypothetical protein